jgi:hypothetical protein
MDDSTNSCLNDDENELTKTIATDSVNKFRNQDDNEDEHINLLKSRVKHLFILSENGKPVFTRFNFLFAFCILFKYF